jgi:ligand-binding SRPBCC domain-containing protein
MKIKIITRVKADLQAVKAGFTDSLFLKLNPPFPPVKLRRFDGCKKGDKVELELDFVFFKQTWESLITDDVLSTKEFSFVDEGVRLPFFLKSWKHHHLNEALENGGTSITDEIEFTTPTLLTNLLFYPVLYLQFLYRKPIYRKVFGK